ncbi:MAG: hypothetical protein Q9191_007700 [Dirinaria sp. TL-2023a]
MLFTTAIIIFGLIAHPALISAAAPPLGQIVSAVGGLSRTAEGIDEDIKDINALTGVTQANKIADDIQTFVGDIQNVQDGAQGTKPVGDDPEEEQLTGAFGSFEGSTDQLLEDLDNKVNELNEVGQGKAIETALEDLKPVVEVRVSTLYEFLRPSTPILLFSAMDGMLIIIVVGQNFAAFIAGLLKDGDEKDVIYENTANIVSDISTDEDQYEEGPVASKRARIARSRVARGKL